MDAIGFCTSGSLRMKTRKGAVVCKMDGTKSTTSNRVGRLLFASRSTAAVVASTLFVLSPLNPAIAIISAPPCIKGEGPGCEASAAESSVIRDLLEKSRVNRENTDKAVLEKYWQQGYGDYFSFGYNKELKKDEDGKWRLQDPEGLFAAIQRRLQALAKKDN